MRLKNKLFLSFFYFDFMIIKLILKMENETKEKLTEIKLYCVECGKVLNGIDNFFGHDCEV